MDEQMEAIKSAVRFLGVSSYKATSEKCAMAISEPRTELGFSAEPIVTRAETCGI